MENQQHKRQWRELDDATRERISRSTQGKPKSELHKQRIRQALIDYWKTIPHRPKSGITMDDLIGA